MDTFPTDLLPPRGLRYWLAGVSVTGGAAMVGPGQFADWSAGGWWCADYDLGALTKPLTMKLYRAILMRISSGATEIIVPIVDDPQLPWGPDGRQDPPTSSHSDGAPFSDDSLYVQTTINYVLTEPLEERATSATIRRLGGGELTGGEYFTLIHPTARDRAYLIEGLERDGDDYRIDFGPPAREHAFVNDLADFEKPRTVMRLIPEAGGAWPTIERPFKASPSLKFVESFDYLLD